MKKTFIATSAIAALSLSLFGAIGASADQKFGGGKGFPSILKELRSSGVLTQNQVDAITNAMKDVRNHVHEAHAARTKVITNTLGIDAATLESRRKAGESLAAIAGEKRAALISALVAFETQRIDSAQVAGKITSERATSLKSKLEAGITAMLDHEGKFGKGHKGLDKKAKAREGR